MFVKSTVARFYTPVEERGKIMVFKRLGGQDRTVPEARDDVVEGVLEGWPVHRTVILVELEQLPGSFKSRFWRLGRQHTGHIERGKLPCVVSNLARRVILRFAPGLIVVR